MLQCFSALASFCIWAGQFESYPSQTSEDRLSRDMVLLDSVDTEKNNDPAHKKWVLMRKTNSEGPGE